MKTQEIYKNTKLLQHSKKIGRQEYRHLWEKILKKQSTITMETNPI